MKQNLDLENDFYGKKQEPKKSSKFWGFIKEFFGVILISLVIVIPIRYYLVQPFVVRGASMEPGFLDGEYLVVSEIEYRINDPERGDVIVFKYPKEPSEYYIKRIVGLPGERIAIRGGKVTIFNAQHPTGLVLNESEYLPNGRITRGDLSKTLGDDEYFVLGDNREASSDSRVWGILPEELIIGRAWIRAYPLNRFTVFSE
ncbi:MAG: signal peptidase I [Patescibacteria group bacterium]|nr:signal peptidase I [Patescibacteria group bacterium]